MKKLLYIICSTLIIIFGQNVMAEELEKLSAYKVTTYNLGALLDYNGNSDIQLRNYEPLMITSTKADMLNEQSTAGEQLRTTPDLGGSSGFAISAEYQPISSLALQGTFGMARNNWDPSSDEHKGSWEANLGVVYNLINNLNYEIHFGYMATGDLFTERNSYSDVENIIMVSNKLSMSF